MEKVLKFRGSHILPRAPAISNVQEFFRQNKAKTLSGGGGGGIGTSANASPSNLLLAGVGKTIQIYYGAYGDAFANGAVSESYPNVSGSSHVHDRFSRGRGELVWAADILD